MLTHLSDVEEIELNYVCLSYCTMVSLIIGKKLNIANVFLQFLKNRHLRAIFKQKTDTENDYEAVCIFLKFEPTLYKSKYIMKYLNGAGKFKIK